MSDMRTRQEQQVSYREKDDRLVLSYGGPVAPFDFYRDLYPVGFLQSSYRVDGTAEHNGKFLAVANAIHARKRDGEHYRKNHFVTDDLARLLQLQSQVAFVAPCSFIAGKGKGSARIWAKKDLNHLRFVHAFVVDLDYVDLKEVKGLQHQVKIGYMPEPTYIVNSGTGLHLYYVLEDPVRVFPKEQHAYAALKHALIDLCWNEFTSQGEDKQYSGLVQPYRIVGSRSKLDCDARTEDVISQEWTVKAYKVGKKWTVDELLRFDPPTTALTGTWPKSIAIARELFDNPGKKTPEEWRELNPDWYERRIVRKEPPKPVAEYKFHVPRHVYDAWLRRIRDEARVGHRYHCIRMLAIYALKCDVPFDELRRDAYGLLDTFESRTTEETNHFKASDIDTALLAYRDVDNVKTTAQQTAYYSGLEIKKRGRDNPLPQAEHLELARTSRDIRQRITGTPWYDGGGRPKGSPNKEHPKRDVILAYAAEHPLANHSEIARALGISRPTVIKWLKNRD